MANTGKEFKKKKKDIYLKKKKCSRVSFQRVYFFAYKNILYQF